MKNFAHSGGYGLQCNAQNPNTIVHKSYISLYNTFTSTVFNNLHRLTRAFIFFKRNDRDTIYRHNFGPTFLLYML